MFKEPFIVRRKFTYKCWGNFVSKKIQEDGFAQQTRNNTYYKLVEDEKDKSWTARILKHEQLYKD